MLTQESMEHLLNNEWFNDEIVNSYLATLFKENHSVGLLDSYTLAHNKRSRDETVSTCNPLQYIHQNIDSFIFLTF